MEYIGILTHCIANNFGANLQALSTASFLRSKGYEPIFLKWDSYLKEKNSKMDSRQLVIHQSFLRNLGFIVSKSLLCDDDFISIINKYHIHNILVGSDAVLTISSWLDKITISRKGIKIKEVTQDKLFPNPFWIPFASRVDNCKFFLLSPSCQSTHYKLISSRTLEQMRFQLQKFSYLSARDTCTLDMINYICGNKPKVKLTPDPVWAFNANVKDIPTKEYIKRKFNLQDKYFLMSFYNHYTPKKEWINTFVKESNKNEYAVYNLPMPQGYFEGSIPKIGMPINPLEWYSIIKYSRGYVGNNMHPIIVSIHNNVPFYSIDHHGKYILGHLSDKTSKVYDLLNRFELLQYRTNYRKISNISPIEIFKKLTTFDTGKNQLISATMLNEYFDMMNTICSFFK